MKEITIVELLSMIKRARTALDDNFKCYIDPNANARSMVSLYNNITHLTISGRDRVDVYEEIVRINSDITHTILDLQKLLMIKEQVNSMCTLTVPNPDGEGEITLSIAQILVLTSESVKRYKIGYLRKLEEDLQYAKNALEQHQKTALSKDKIDRYVEAKMNSLNMRTDIGLNKINYESFAEEYIRANKMELYDPLEVDLNIHKRIAQLQKFYDVVEVKLLEFNATTKIWIDLDFPDKFWGFVDKEIALPRVHNETNKENATDLSAFDADDHLILPI